MYHWYSAELWQHSLNPEQTVSIINISIFSCWCDLSQSVSVDNQTCLIQLFIIISSAVSVMLTVIMFSISLQRQFHMKSRGEWDRSGAMSRTKQCCHKLRWSEWGEEWSNYWKLFPPQVPVPGICWHVIIFESNIATETMRLMQPVVSISYKHDTYDVDDDDRNITIDTMTMIRVSPGWSQVSVAMIKDDCQYQKYFSVMCSSVSIELLQLSWFIRCSLHNTNYCYRTRNIDQLFASKLPNIKHAHWSSSQVVWCCWW